MGFWKWSSFFWGGGEGPSSGFGSSSTAEEVTQGIRAGHLTAIVTGATSGIGKETARVLALRGATVVIPCRTLESGRKVKESILEHNPDARIDIMEMDLSSLDSVGSFARAFNSSYQHLNILINNAGIMASPFQLSKDGVELQFATNHLGHFQLTNLLLDKMKKTAKETGIQGRIINVSSLGHTRQFDESCFNLEKINDQSKYAPFGAYSHSKLANIWHANELSRRLQEEGSNVAANSLHPGAISTNLCRYLNLKPFILDSIAAVMKAFVKSIPQRRVHRRLVI
ncbi:short-chain dehydrogenase TIC 32, chloroplastic-like isoform X2 [Phoenix dactylifera]|uniref:Short-chain dehydrogenase TIC 32, chloroplastic-like isoform X2 n=1 Tax=Phoenix dactylifera TaxID=42345 RepID=A0A8B7CH91_PHODC|nr:short-chain dehydrogenase TIC 32, chloroplastic-like isoform X2 [Phoenix dactylifera]